MPADERDEDKDMVGLIDGDARVAACVLQASVLNKGQASYRGRRKKESGEEGKFKQTMGRSLYIAKLTRLG